LFVESNREREGLYCRLGVSGTSSKYEQQQGQGEIELCC
jgi:hypothetical protein